ncbi:hypothetical protein Syun_017783 [Stephania yunnanensis]|uniref:Peptidase A1 domain-containing protein n=1 Tax=Stephania yunnanensis TaxID=152371 RepID=A0AAP0J9V7_9MAGN
MTTPIVVVSLALITITLTTLCLPSAARASVGLKCDVPDRDTTLKVMHVYDKCSPFRPAKGGLSWEETVVETMRKDDARVVYLSSLVARKSVAPIASGRQIIQSPTYVVRAKVGTPAQTLVMAMDTSNDAAWVPCSGCVGCTSTLFATAMSTTYKTLGCQAPQCQQVSSAARCTGTTPTPSCTFNQTYGSSAFAATLSSDTLTLATDPIPNYTFACLSTVTGTSIPPQGLLGLGRGPLSLLSQSQSLYSSTFSYCLPHFSSSNFSGSLRLGPVAQPLRIKTTPLLRNPHRPSLYYVNMIAIRVGRRIVDIPPSALAFDPATGAGTIFDSGTVFTRLVKDAYVPMRDQFRRRVGLPNVTSLGGFDTCYNNVPSTFVFPTISFHFAGMNVTMPVENLLIHSTAGGITCLAMAAAPDNVNSVVNVIASMQQQNHRVLFDVPNNRLGVARERCT